MIGWRKKLAVSATACAIVFSSVSGVVDAACMSAVDEVAMANQGSVIQWKQWVKKNAKPISSIVPESAVKGSVSSDQYEDLQFLKPLLKDKGMVSLGEASHGASEYNSAKVRLVQFLHEQMGYDVLAFESNLGEASAAYAQVGLDSPEDTMKKSIYGVWHVQEVLPLFEYIAQQSKTEHPLILTGLDVQGTSEPFIGFVEKWFSTVDKSKSVAFGQTERWYLKVHTYDDLERFNREQPQLIKKYRTFQQFVKENKAELQDVYPAHPELVPVIERVLQNRIDMLESYCIHMVKLFAGIEPERQMKEASYIRDQQMANNAAWLAEELYPDKKIIVWGHNYHVRKHNSTMITEHNGFDYDNHPYPTMGELLPFSLRKDNYVIGLYAYQGSSNKSSKETEQISQPHQEGSIEDLLHAGGHPYQFLDLTQAKLEPSTSWMFTPRVAKSWGVLEENMIVRDQYDGLLFIDTIHPSQRLSKVQPLDPISGDL
ncbi:erythromycin esterase family protein [Paenibacillus sp. KQZ6P-2]|uniref:Erythromycin esterase family protein n=1 Tax=Paenibacillus mangrovi TaxID=2931978 RepID=A0A9X1WQJ4_9BACL|nr:erythromycin esterase family protein [Paenibacillus mangrovi]MCJ8013497.1 erythromycin esterase family protein [Paenibacillus mangrovi]